jgi:pyruvate dehydrogenase E2 component (dihydrolipoamide acetyltransferase)
VHIGFATAIEDGLLTPVVRDCHLKSIGRIARDTAALIERARRRAITPEELSDGTFTISNLGMYDVVGFSAIINPPQAGILAIARPVERPVADAGRVVLRKVLATTLSADHRVVDGVTGAEFLQAFKGVLEQPERLML